MKKKLLVSLIAVVLVLALGIGVFAACNKNDNNGNVNPEPAPVGPSGPSYDELYDALYNAALGDFADELALAKASGSVSERYAKMAIAEAKLLESGTFIPTTSQGGRYAISKAVYGTVSPVGWGLDADRLYTTIVVDKYVTAADRDELKARYAAEKAKGETGDYITAAKTFLAGAGYTLANVYNMGYSEDPSTWDITNTYRTVDSEAIVNTYDGLLAYDVLGRMQPALAKALPTVSADGLKYTFELRENVKWVDKDGTEYADVQASDFVYGMQRILDNQATSYLVDGVLKGAHAYLAGTDTDFSHVGVKAVSKYVLEYELEAPCSFFLSMFNYNPFAPVCKAYVEAQGDNYGIDPAHILYNGPYIVSNYTKDNKIVFSKNAKYYNAGAINVGTINWISYHENDDPSATYKDMKDGKIDGAGLNTTTVPMAKEDGLFDTYAYVSGTNSTSYGFFTNIYREAYSTAGVEADSKQTDAQKAVTKAAMNNAHFRMAFARGLDRAAYNAIAVGTDCANYSLINSYTPGNFVSLEEDVTVDINGKPVEFKAGTFYGAIVQAQLDADMGKDAMKVWDPDLDGGLGSSAGYDGWYNTAVAKKYLKMAIAELADQGVVVSKTNPIHIDYPIWSTYDIYKNRAVALQQKVATDFEGLVVLDLVETTQKGWYYVGYYAESGAECNYDIYDCSGWGPDYGDPQTYLNTMLRRNGDMIKMLGIY